MGSIYKFKRGDTVKVNINLNHMHKGKIGKVVGIREDACVFKYVVGFNVNITDSFTEKELELVEEQVENEISIKKGNIVKIIHEGDSRYGELGKISSIRYSVSSKRLECWIEFQDLNFHHYNESEFEIITETKENIRMRHKEFNSEAAKAGAPVQTRDGKPVRILCFDRKSKLEFPIIALIEIEDGVETIGNYKADGKCHERDSLRDSDLVMVVIKKIGWINIYPDNRVSSIYQTEEAAKQDALVYTETIDTVKIEYHV